MTPAKEPKDRRQDKEERLRYAIRKANDRMFAHLTNSAIPQETKNPLPNRQPH